MSSATVGSVSGIGMPSGMGAWWSSPGSACWKEAIIEKIMLGKEKKFREESALLKQSFAKDPSKTVKQYIGNATVVAYVRVAVG
jgi:hypothetical protein